MSEATLEKTYNNLVAEQMAILSAHFLPSYSPLTFPMRKRGFTDDQLIPLWILPFEKKPVMPKGEDIFSYTITNEIILMYKRVPREYRAIEIEREIIPDRHGREALVERVYYVFVELMGGHRIWVASSSVETKYSDVGDIIGVIGHSQVDDSGSMLVNYKPTVSPRDFLQFELPLIVPPADRVIDHRYD